MGYSCQLFFLSLYKKTLFSFYSLACYIVSSSFDSQTNGEGLYINWVKHVVKEGLVYCQKSQDWISVVVETEKEIKSRHVSSLNLSSWQHPFSFLLVASAASRQGTYCCYFSRMLNKQEYGERERERLFTLQWYARPTFRRFWFWHRVNSSLGRLKLELLRVLLHDEPLAASTVHKP